MTEVTTHKIVQVIDDLELFVIDLKHAIDNHDHEMAEDVTDRLDKYLESQRAT